MNFLTIGAVILCSPGQPMRSTRSESPTVSARDTDDEVIVVDDAGQDETGAFLAKEFPAVRFIR